MSATLFLFIPSLVFLTIVAPLWLILHYWSKHKSRQGLSQDDEQLIDQLTTTIQGLEQRIDSLERILNSQHQGWNRDQ